MAVAITYFVHGTTIDNERGISSGWSDVELSGLGIRQSHELAQKIDTEGFDAVFTSNLRRAYESARISWGDKREIIRDERLRECNYGEYDGEPSEIVEPLQEHFIAIPFPNGESYEDVKIRISSFLEDLKRNYDRKCIAIVAHKAPQLTLEVLLNGKTWKQAFAEDWRKTKSWQPGWSYALQ